MEASKAYLMKTDENGVSVYSHLTNVLAVLLDSQPASALDAFEATSLATKKMHYAAGAAAVTPAAPELPDPAAPVPASLAWAESTAALLKPKPSEEEPSGTVANLMYESSLFECAGVGLGPAETYRVYVSLVNLQKDLSLSSVRFFGKVLGAAGVDYYIAEGAGYTPPDPEEGVEPPPPPPGAPVEEAGTGCNSFTYFAATDPSGTWTPLPDVTPQQIIYSKRIRKYVTGDLEADVRAYPPFPGQEKAYLRALIARIVAATTLCPTGKFTVDAEDPSAPPTEVEVGGEEGRTPPPASALGELSGWCTRYMGILDIGRCTNLPREEDEEGNPIGPEPQPQIPYLAPITEESWACTTYVHGAQPVAVAKSLSFPGAICAYQLQKGGTEALASIYIGYGVEALSAPFVMEAPPPFELEPEEVHEQADMPLSEENAIFLEKEKARIAEEAAALPDPEE